ncbi:MAG: hypothetical protein JXA95_10400 [Spirochaetales bacterium]|nr:hypothetical protein [Spirochaetales bacterium]
MSRIKSALELALEKTSDIEADRGALMRAETVKSAKRRVALFLEGEGDDLADREIKEKEIYEETLKEALFAQLKLPRMNIDLARTARLEKAFDQMILSAEGKEDLASLFGQLKNLFAQYLDSQEQLIESLSAQYEPMLRQKEERLREQTGQSVRLRPEQDPEFMKFLKDRQQMMDDQYNEVIIQAKDQLRELL